MIARGAQGNPWIFSEVQAALNGTPYVPPTLAERLSVALAHARDMVAEKGERTGIPEARKHMAWYVHGVRGAAGARGEIMKAASLAALEEVFDSLLSSSQEGTSESAEVSEV
jgi:tRNA-dihydrouridine synthase